MLDCVLANKNFVLYKVTMVFKKKALSRMSYRLPVVVVRDIVTQELQLAETDILTHIIITVIAWVLF